MNVFFEPENGSCPFSIEVGYFDSVLEIKEKIQKDQGIPVSKQTLIFNGNVLNDELNVLSYKILDHSRISLIIAPDPETQKSSASGSGTSHMSPIIAPDPERQKSSASGSGTSNIVETSLELSMPVNPLKRIPLILKITTTSKLVLEMDINDSVRRLKEKIREREDVPLSRLMIHVGGVELRDHQILRDCKLVDHSEIDVNVMPTSPTTIAGSSGNITGSKKLKILVLTVRETGRIPMKVSYSDNVEHLRNELEKLKPHLDLDLPEDGYFFVHKTNVMDEDRSFRQHNVKKGDTIAICPGTMSDET